MFRRQISSQMDLAADIRIPFPPGVVFTACRDRMAQLTPYLPAIRSIVVTHRAERGPIVENAVQWSAGADVPASLRALFGEALFTWTDYATWYADTLSCDWWTETQALGGAVRCCARDHFLANDDGGTVLEIRGTLSVDATKIRGVPRLLEGRVGRATEEYLVRKIKNDTARMATTLARLLGEGGDQRPPERA
jgi:hypothetical protein